MAHDENDQLGDLAGRLRENTEPSTRIGADPDAKVRVEPRPPGTNGLGNYVAAEADPQPRIDRDVHRGARFEPFWIHQDRDPAAFARVETNKLLLEAQGGHADLAALVSCRVGVAGRIGLRVWCWSDGESGNGGFPLALPPRSNAALPGVSKAPFNASFSARSPT